MGNVLKIGDRFYIEFEARGLKYQQMAGDSEEQAWALLESIEVKIRQGEMAVFTRDVPIPVFIKDFSEFALETYPPKTAARLRAASDHFVISLAENYPSAVVLSHITPKVIEDYKFVLLRGGNKPWVINFTLLLLREMFQYSIKLGYLNDNPTLHISFIPDTRKLSVKDKNNKGVQEFLAKGVTLFRLAQLLEFSDVLKAMRFYPYLRHPV